MASEHGILDVQVIGSLVKFEDGPTNDVNFLVEFEKGRSLFDLIGFKQNVEGLLSTRVTVVTESSIHENIKKDVLNGAIQL